MTTELTTVHLVGSLGKAVGVSEWHLDVKSTAEAIRAININTRGALQRYLEGPARNRLYRIALQKRDNVIDPQEAVHRSGRSTIYIMPTVRGRDSGVGKVILGVALIAFALTNPFGWAWMASSGSFMAGTLSLSYGAAIVAGFGISLVLGGISQMLTPKPQGPTASPEQAQSTAFPGNAASVVQGGCIPVVYGRALVSPVPVSITVTNNDVSITSGGTLGGVVITPLPGGGIQYDPVVTEE